MVPEYPLIFKNIKILRFVSLSVEIYASRISHSTDQNAIFQKVNQSMLSFPESVYKTIIHIKPQWF